MIPILRVKINSVYYMIPAFKQKLEFYFFFSLPKVMTSPIKEKEKPTAINGCPRLAL